MLDCSSWEPLSCQLCTKNDRSNFANLTMWTGGALRPALRARKCSPRRHKILHLKIQTMERWAAGSDNRVKGRCKAFVYLKRIDTPCQVPALLVPVTRRAFVSRTARGSSWRRCTATCPSTAVTCARSWRTSAGSGGPTFWSPRCGWRMRGSFRGRVIGAKLTYSLYPPALRRKRRKREGSGFIDNFPRLIAHAPAALYFSNRITAV